MMRYGDTLACPTHTHTHTYIYIYTYIYFPKTPLYVGNNTTPHVHMVQGES